MHEACRFQVLYDYRYIKLCKLKHAVEVTKLLDEPLGLFRTLVNKNFPRFPISFSDEASEISKFYKTIWFDQNFNIKYFISEGCTFRHKVNYPCEGLPALKPSNLCTILI